MYSWALEFHNTNVCSTIGPGISDVRLTIYPLSFSHGPSMYTLSMTKPEMSSSPGRSPDPLPRQ